LTVEQADFYRDYASGKRNKSNQNAGCLFKMQSSRLPSKMKLNLHILNTNCLMCLQIVGAVSIAQSVAQSFQFYGVILCPVVKFSSTTVRANTFFSHRI
jgi:hypothetical protein